MTTVLKNLNAHQVLWQVLFCLVCKVKRQVSCPSSDA